MDAKMESESKWFTSESLVIFMSQLGIVDRLSLSRIIFKKYFIPIYLSSPDFENKAYFQVYFSL
ncbi:MAG: hypothetical protein L0I93_05285 [Atopostipes suicloacalis]|nr:hypothetical protein [Atopostipes suicloacalis]